jgi:hypothetical protein
MTAYWLICTKDEAVAHVFPRLSQELQGKSDKCSERGTSICSEVCRKMGLPVSPYCYLVAKDGAAIDPFHFSYPFDNMWNAYSPFQEYGPLKIESMEDLKRITTITTITTADDNRETEVGAERL